MLIKKAKYICSGVNSETGELVEVTIEARGYNEALRIANEQYHDDHKVAFISARRIGGCNCSR